MYSGVPEEELTQPSRFPPPFILCVFCALFGGSLKHYIWSAFLSLTLLTLLALRLLLTGRRLLLPLIIIISINTISKEAHGSLSLTLAKSARHMTVTFKLDIAPSSNRLENWSRLSESPGRVRCSLLTC